MGRHYYKKKPDDEGLLDVIIELARKSPAFGFVATVITLAFGASLYSNRENSVQRLFGFVLMLLAGVLALATLMGMISREGRGPGGATPPSKKSKPRQFGPFSTRRERFKNIKATVKRWQTAPTPPSERTQTPQREPASSHRAYVDTPPAGQPSPAPPPAQAASILSKGELAFYLPLRDVVAGQYVVQIKPSLVDVLQARNDPRFRRMAPMHVDFLLCDPATLQPRLAIELDDKSHRRRGLSAADRWKEDLLNDKGIPIMRQWCLPAYDVQALRAAINQKIRS